MENLSPSNDTLANGDDAHKGVMCTRSTFFKKELVYLTHAMQVLVRNVTLKQKPKVK